MTVHQCFSQLSRARYLRSHRGPAAGWHFVFGDFLICPCDIMNMLRVRLFTRGPGRRDTCHLTDFFQAFTAYNGH